MKTATAQKSAPPQFKEPAVTPELGQQFGLSRAEYDLVLKIIGRNPTYTELGIFSVMWSEHCSYKSSRIHLKKLPTEAAWVIQGPGENAGVIDIGDNQAAVFKMESHNHPSYIEPYQGAATGVGGIMRDVFTMGARPIANLNALRFGEPSHPKTRGLVSGVVAGISGYGNCVGVPTVGGETNFHASYNGNNLVNAMTVGLADQDKIYYARGAGVDQPIVYVGSKTGRDGIHGATMSSKEFEDGVEAERPTVQVGDPFTEKLLIEACLELMQQDAIISIQDMGAAGLTSSSVEIASKGDIGVILTLDDVPQREPGMVPYEIMLSESQERMLMILKPGKEEMAREIFEKWDLDFAVIGRTTADKHLKLYMYDQLWCDIPVPPLVDQSPLYDRPSVPTPKQTPLDDAAYPLPNNDALAAFEQTAWPAPISPPSAGSGSNMIHWSAAKRFSPPAFRTIRRCVRAMPPSCALRANKKPSPYRPMSRHVTATPIRTKAANRPWRRAGAISPLSVQPRLPSPTTSTSATLSVLKSWANWLAVSKVWAMRHVRLTTRSSPATYRFTTKPAARVFFPRQPSAVSASSKTTAKRWVLDLSAQATAFSCLAIRAAIWVSRFTCVNSMAKKSAAHRLSISLWSAPQAIASAISSIKASSPRVMT